MEIFKKIASFVDIETLIKKMNIIEDEDFKHFLESNKIFDVRSKTYPNEENDEVNEAQFTVSPFSKLSEEERFNFVTKPRHQKLLKKITNFLEEHNQNKSKNSSSIISTQLMNTLKKEEENDNLNDEFYDKINLYLHNENLLITQNEQIIANPEHNEANFSEHKKNRQAAKLFENYHAFKEIQGIKEILSSLGINTEGNNKQETFDNFYSNYSQQVDNFRKTLKNVSLDILRKNMEEFKQIKKSSGERRNALALKGQNLKKSVMMKKSSMSMNASLYDGSAFLSPQNSKNKFKNLSIETDPIRSPQFSKDSKDSKFPKTVNFKTENSVKSTNGVFPTIPLTHLQFQTQYSSEDPDQRLNFKFAKYQEQMNFINEHFLNNRKNDYATKFNLLKTFNWFVNDIEELEKKNVDEKKILDEKFRNYNDKLNIFNARLQSRGSKMNSKIYSSFKDEHVEGATPLIKMRKKI